MTLRLYAERKTWDLGRVDIELSHDRVHARDCEECEDHENARIELIRVNIAVTGDLDAEQLERLHQIAERCPVHRNLAGGPEMITKLERTG